MDRRGFLGAMLAAAMAPAIVRAESLMPIVAPKIILPPDPFARFDGVDDAMLASLTAGSGFVFQWMEKLPDGEWKPRRRVLTPEEVLGGATIALGRLASGSSIKLTSQELAPSSPASVVGAWGRLPPPGLQKPR